MKATWSAPKKAGSMILPNFNVVTVIDSAPGEAVAGADISIVLTLKSSDTIVVPAWIAPNVSDMPLPGTRYALICPVGVIVVDPAVTVPENAIVEPPPIQ